MSGCRQVWLGVAFALAVLVVGCGGAGGESDAQVPDGQVPDAQMPDAEIPDAGAPRTEAPPTEAPAPTADPGGLGVPIAPAADGVTNMESGGMTIVQYNVPLDRAEATIAFYDDWTSRQAADYVRTESESGGVGWQNVPTPGADKQIIAVLSPLEGDEFVTVTLTVGPSE